MTYRVLQFLLTFVYLLARFQSTPGVLTPGGIVVNDTDPYYRLHRIERMATGHLTYPLHESDLSFPKGIDVPWPIGLDMILAAPLKWAQVDSRPSVEAFAAVAIPIFSLPTLWFTQSAATLVAGPVAGLSAGLLIALSPAAIAASAVGRIDHHFLETMLTAMLFWLLARIILRKSRLAWTGLALLLAFAPSFWPQAWILGIFAAGAFLIHLEKDLRRPVSHLFVFAGLMSLWPLALTDRLASGYLDLFGFSWWTPVVYLKTAMVFTLLDFGARKALRPTWIQKSGALLLLGAGVFLVFRNGTGVGWSKVVQSSAALRPTEGSLATTTETLPTLFIPLNRWPDMGLIPLGLAWLWFSLQAFRRERWWIVGFLITPLFLASLQARFVPLACAAMILGSVFLFNDILTWAVRNVTARRIALFLICILLTVPSNPGFAFKRDLKTHPFFPAVVESAAFLKGRPRGPIAAHWDFGHWLLYYTGMPVIAHPFQDNAAMETMRLFVSEEPDALERFASKYPARYLLVEKPTTRIEQWLRVTGKNPADYAGRFERLFAPRWFLHGGASDTGQFPKNWRLIFASSARSGASDRAPFLKVFERVPGARIRARGVRPGTSAQIHVSAPDSDFTFRSGAVFFPDGTAEFTVPYAEVRSGNVGSDGDVFFVTPDGEPARSILKLKEKDVSEGRLIDLGTLRW